VPLFQEQAMKLTMVGANFSAGDADRLRRSMAHLAEGGVDRRIHDKIISGMLLNGYTKEFAEQSFNQIRGFGLYGFPESHAASFALLVYISSWLKRYHPAAFCAALLNSQPMGFYAPAQIVQDAQQHGVEFSPAISTFRLGLLIGGNVTTETQRHRETNAICIPLCLCVSVVQFIHRRNQPGEKRPLRPPRLPPNQRPAASLTPKNP